MHAFRAFANTHDRSPAFHAAYLSITVIIAAMLNLGAFALLIAAHMALDTIKYREVHGLKWKYVLRGVVRENLIDIVLLALCFASMAYLHHGTGIIAASGLLRSQATLLKGIILVAAKSKILLDVLHVLSVLPAHMQHMAVHPKKPWTAFECFCFGVLGACMVLLLALLPMMTGISFAVLREAFVGQMVPWHI